MTYIFIHGFNSNADSNEWMQDLAKRAKGETFLPNLPTSDSPIFSEWYEVITTILDKIEEDVTLIAHSLGGFLALKIAEEYTIKKMILVAPAYLDYDKKDFYLSESNRPQEQKDALIKFYDDVFQEKKGLDIKSINLNCDDIKIFYSQNDKVLPPDTISNLKRDFQNATYTNLPHYGHFMEVEGVTKIKEIYHSIV